MVKASKQQKIYQSFKFFFKLFGLSNQFDSYFKVEKFSRSLHPLHFDQIGFSAKEKRKFFKKQLVEIEIETHAYCNRRCSFCPNVSGIRTDKNQLLPMELFKGIIDELSEIDFKGTIKFHRFNEPLANDIIFDRIRYARKKLPYAHLGFHSNGDFVDEEKLKRLTDIGLDFLWLSLYINFNESGRNYLTLAKKHCIDYGKRFGFKTIPVNSERDLVKYTVLGFRFEFVIFVPDICRKGNDRGGSLRDYSKEIRISPCVSPFGRLFIDWTGDVMPCCNLRSDINSHRNYILGNVREHSLEFIYFSDVSNKIRRNLFDFSEKEGACKTCNYDVFCYSKQAVDLMKKIKK